MVGLEIRESAMSPREGFRGAEEDTIDAATILVNCRQCHSRLTVLKCECKTGNFGLITWDGCLEEARVLLETSRP